jgi:hypothetical protein
MTFDPTITFGAILNAGVLLVGFVVAFTRIGGRIDLLSMRLGSVEEAVKAQRDVDARIATVEERLTNHVTMLTTAQRDISDLRRGNGFIRTPRDRVDGEYS